ncbi:sugar phosphate isomerase/epimerase [Mucilaginibacter gossypii]|uniref:sugar phosphate isomerase/epimerase family protein n=1 Tax=Mucilaginibacter gossypii TaxID=551996 RepID=UPI000DCD3E71|nr:MULTISPECIES: sugar phosphate isomerase/epimerase [Mucilaginibacter]QTE39892.1 sugar phosphate isomerase/epimerase [Mucilaginibacter gossypii]RAV54483.1 sugar phosphate isomerase/epimerase [Mucilaginibacter rubeus]
MKQHNLSRRRFIGSSALAAAGLLAFSKSSFAGVISGRVDKPNSLINGVQIGVITYSFRSMPGTIEDLLRYCIDCNINAIELMGDAAEMYAGAPKHEAGEDWAAFGKKMAEWRVSAPMDKFKEIRKMYHDAGVNIYAWKPNALGTKNSDAEIDYAFNAGKALGVNHVTVELPDEVQTKRLGDIAAKHKMMVGYHAHTQATPTLWDAALAQSKHNGINLDIGHYVAGTSSSPVPFIEKYHDRITSMHIKDRKFHDGPNQPWGQGDTPIKEVLQLLKNNHYKFPATIELEYKIPEGSDAVKEVKICRQFAADALA